MAESPVISCPECKKKFKGKGNLEGKKIKCPFCAKPFLVPAKAGADGAEESTAGPGGLPAQVEGRKIFAGEDSDPNPYKVTDLDIAPRCPNCANKMANEEAFICLFCGYNTLTREIGKTEKIIAHSGGEVFSHLLPAFIAVLGIFILLILAAFYSLMLPEILAPDGPRWLVHESLRFWLTLIVLGVSWPLGFFAYKRLIINTTPEEKKMD